MKSPYAQKSVAVRLPAADLETIAENSLSFLASNGPLASPLPDMHEAGDVSGALHWWDDGGRETFGRLCRENRNRSHGRFVMRAAESNVAVLRAIEIAMRPAAKRAA